VQRSDCFSCFASEFDMGRHLSTTLTFCPVDSSCFCIVATDVPFLNNSNLKTDVELEPLENGSNSEGVELQKLQTWQLLNIVQRRACKNPENAFC
jgi:hypothetical protein